MPDHVQPTNAARQTQPLSPAAQVTTVLMAFAVLACLPLLAAVGLILQFAFAIAAPTVALAALVSPPTRSQ